MATYYCTICRIRHNMNSGMGIQHRHKARKGSEKASNISGLMRKLRKHIKR